MAYTFDRINSLFDKPQEDKADAFSGKGSVTGNYGTVKTTTGGDISSGETGGGTNTGGEAAVPQNILAPTGAAIKRNVAKAQTPQAVTKIGQDLQSSQQNLQNEANQYVQDYQSRNYGVADADIDAAVSGDTQKISDLAQRYSKKAYGTVDQFAPKTDTDIEDVQLLGNEGGIKRLLAREAGNQYSAGEGAFDVGLLRRNNQFNLISDQLKRQQQALTQETGKLKEEKTKTAQQEADTRYQAGTQELEADLKAREGQTLTEAEQAALAVNQRREALRQQGDQDFIAQNAAKAKEEALRDIMAYNPRAKRFFEQLQLDPNKFYQVGSDVARDDVLNEDQASKFNRIQDILGTGQTKQAGKGAGEDQQFDVAGLQNYARDTALGQRNVEDKRLQQLIDSIKGQTTKRATDFNLARQSQDEKIYNDARTRLMAQLSGINEQDVRNYLDPERIAMSKRLEQLAPKYEMRAKPQNPGSLSIPQMERVRVDGGGGIAGDDEYNALKAEYDRRFPSSGVGADWSQITSQMQNPGSLSIDTPYGRLAKMAGANLNMRDYVAERPEAYWDQAFNEDEVNQYNAALEDLGVMAPRAQVGKGFSQAQLNEQALRDALSRYNTR